MCDFLAEIISGENRLLNYVQIMIYYLQKVA